MPESTKLSSEEAKKLEEDITNYIQLTGSKLNGKITPENENELSKLEKKITNTLKNLHELPPNITQKLLMRFCKLKMKDADSKDDKNYLSKTRDLADIMSPPFLDRLLLGKGQTEDQKNKNQLAAAGKKFVKKFMLSGSPSKNKKNSNKPFFSTITHDFSLIRLKFQDHLEKKIMSGETQDNEEKQTASAIQKKAIRALKGKWEELCREFDNPKLDVKDPNYAALYNTVGCLFKASQLPDYITQGDLIKFANSDPTRFLTALDSGKNKPFLARLGDIEKFKEKLGMKNDSTTGEAFNPRDEINEKLAQLSKEQKKQNELENSGKILSQTDELVSSLPDHTQVTELTLEQTIAFKLMGDSHNKPEAVKIAMRAAADNVLHVLDEPQNPEYYKDILKELQTIKEAVPGTSTKEYRQMVYAHAKQATANIFNKIDKETQESPTNNAEEKSNKILSYLEALKIEWEVEQETFKQKNEIHHKNRIQYLEDCINELRKNENNSQEWVILPNISTALGNFNKALDTIPPDFRGTKTIKQNLSRLKEEYITPKKSVEIKQEEKSETKLSEPNPKTSPRKTSTASMFSLFAHRKQPSQETIQNSNDLKNTTKPMKP